MSAAPLGRRVRRQSWAVRAECRAGEWSVDLLARHAHDVPETLEQALGDPAEGGWPGPFVVVQDEGLYFVVLRHGPGGMVRALVSDQSLQEWVLVCEVIERYGIGAEPPGDRRGDDAEEDYYAEIVRAGGDPPGPGGDLDVLADDGLPADELRAILAADDLWADEMVARIAERLGFADALAAAVAP